MFWFANQISMIIYPVAYDFLMNVQYVAMAFIHTKSHNTGYTIMRFSWNFNEKAPEIIFYTVLKMTISILMFYVIFQMQNIYNFSDDFSMNAVAII